MRVLVLYIKYIIRISSIRKCVRSFVRLVFRVDCCFYYHINSMLAVLIFQATFSSCLIPMGITPVPFIFTHAFDLVFFLLPPAMKGRLLKMPEIWKISSHTETNKSGSRRIYPTIVVPCIHNAFIIYCRFAHTSLANSTERYT